MKREFWVDFYKSLDGGKAYSCEVHLSKVKHHKCDDHEFGLHVIDFDAYAELKAHAEAMAHAIEQINEHGFAKAMDRAKEYREWSNE